MWIFKRMFSFQFSRASFWNEICVLSCTEIPQVHSVDLTWFLCYLSCSFLRSVVHILDQQLLWVHDSSMLSTEWIKSAFFVSYLFYFLCIFFLYFLFFSFYSRLYWCELIFDKLSDPDLIVSHQYACGFLSRFGLFLCYIRSHLFCWYRTFFIIFIGLGRMTPAAHVFTSWCNDTLWSIYLLLSSSLGKYCFRCLWLCYLILCLF